MGVFVVPVVSVLTSLAPMGLLPGGGAGSDADSGQGQSIDVLGLLGGGSNNTDGGDYRLLQGEYNTTAVYDIDDVDGNCFGAGFMTFTKVCLVLLGIGLALSIHFFKMLVRVSSLVCSGGTCQPCITVSEFALVVFGVIFAIVAPLFAIVASFAFLIAAGYVLYVRCCRKKTDDDGDNDNTGKNKRNSSSSSNNNSSDDVENQEGTKTKRNTSMTAATTIPSEEVFAEAVVVPTLPPPLAPAAAAAPTRKPDVEA